MEEKAIIPLPYKRPDKAYLEMMDYIVRASEAVSQLCYVPRDLMSVNLNLSRSAEGVTKITVKPKIDWLAINREMHDGSY